MYGRRALGGFLCGGLCRWVVIPPHYCHNRFSVFGVTVTNGWVPSRDRKRPHSAVLSDIAMILIFVEKPQLTPESLNEYGIYAVWVCEFYF